MGIGVALLAVVLVTRAPGHDASTPSGIEWGLLGGVAIGLFNVCIGQLSGAGAFGPLVLIRLVQAGILLAIIVLGRQAWRMPLATARWLIVIGLLDMAGNAAFILAAQAGDARDRRDPVVALPGRHRDPRDRRPPRAADAQPRRRDRAHGRRDRPHRAGDRGLVSARVRSPGEDLRQGGLRGAGDVRARGARRRDAGQGRAARGGAGDPALVPREHPRRPQAGGARPLAARPGRRLPPRPAGGGHLDRRHHPRGGGAARRRARDAAGGPARSRAPRRPCATSGSRTA